MIKEMNEAADLVAWADKNMQPGILCMEEVETIFGYLKVHDYSLGTDEYDNLVWIDCQEPICFAEEIELPEVVAIIMGWNSDLLREAIYSEDDEADAASVLATTSYEERLQKDYDVLWKIYDEITPAIKERRCI